MLPRLLQQYQLQLFVGVLIGQSTKSVPWTRMTEPFALPGLKNQAEIAILPYVLYNYVIPAKNTIRGENTMNKTELIAVMAETSGLSKKDCDAALAAFITTVETALKSGEKVQLIGFGSFEVSGPPAPDATPAPRRPWRSPHPRLPYSRRVRRSRTRSGNDRSTAWEKIPGRAFCRTSGSCVCGIRHVSM